MRLALKRLCVLQRQLQSLQETPLKTTERLNVQSTLSGGVTFLVWLFKFIIDSSPPLEKKWGSGEQSAVSSRSNFAALTCLQIKKGGKLPAGGEVAERLEELEKRESGLHFMKEFSVPPSAAYF